MKVIITPSKLSGTVTIPASKSITHRALICAALANGTSKITNVLFSDDTRYTMQALQLFGAGLAINEKHCTVTVHGTNGNLKKPEKPIYVGNSGTTARLIIGLAALVNGKTIVTGTDRLFERPFDDLFAALKQQKITAYISNKQKEIIIESTGFLPGGEMSISGAKSSQFISALLLITPFAHTITTITVTDIKSLPYIGMTQEVMSQFGIEIIAAGVNRTTSKFTISPNSRYKARTYKVEGDYSSASYFVAANTLGAKIQIKGLTWPSIQPDAQIVKFSDLKSFTDLPDMKDFPDIVPTLAIMTAFKKGTTTIGNIAHLRGKESDRIEAVMKNLNAMGIKTSSTHDSLTIIGGKPHCAIIKTCDDHRIAMSFAIAALFAKGQTTIEHAEVVAKSYPGFWDDLKSLDVNITAIPH